MAKKKNTRKGSSRTSARNTSRISVKWIRNAVLFLFVFFALFLTIEKLVAGMKESDYFTAKRIIYPASISPRHIERLEGLKGKSLFSIDVKAVRQQLKSGHPQLFQLQVIKQFPDTLWIQAKERKPFLQARIRGYHITMDAEMVALDTSAATDSSLPLVTGLDIGRIPVEKGRRVSNGPLRVAVHLIRAFAREPLLSDYRILELDMSRLSQIRLFLSNGLKVLLDAESIPDKLNKLGQVLSRARVDAGEIESIDLRFNQPIGKKNDR